MAQEVFKAAAMARSLKQTLELALEDQGVTVDAGTDSENWPTLLVKTGDGTADDRLALVIRNDGNGGRVDALGLTQPAYTPHTVDMVIMEGAGETAGPPPIWTPDENFRRRVVLESAKLGAQIEIRSKDGDITDDDDLEKDGSWAALTKEQVIPSSEIHPLTKQM